MSKISNPINAWLNTQDSQFTPTGKSVLIPLELKVLKDWTEATIDFSFTSPDRNLTASSIKISPIVLKNHKAQQITKTDVNLTVSEDGFYDIEAKITVTLDSKTGENKLLTTLSFGVFSFQGKYIYDFSSQAALDKYAEIEALSKPNKEVKTLINFAETNKITSSDNKLILEQMGEISRHIFEEKQKIQALYNNQTPSLLKQSQPTKLSLRKGQKVTLKVRWSIDSRNIEFLPLDKAAIEVEGSDGSQYRGVLNRGEFTFTVPKDNFTFTATVFAVYSDKFTVYKQIEIIDQNGKKSSIDISITTNFSNQLNYDITDGTAPFWSVFSAVMDLTDIAKTHLNFERSKNRKVYVDIKNSSNCFYRSGEIQTINIGKDHYYNWYTLAHEFGHAIANESKAIKFSAGGSHTGENQYDYRNSGTTLYNKKNSIALAFNEGYGTWVGVRLLKHSAYTKKMPYVGGDNYTTVNSNGSMGFNVDLKNHSTLYDAYGEDAEFCLAALLWQVSDQKKNPYIRALCSRKADSISYSLIDIFNRIFKGRNLESISDFYQGMFIDYVGVQSNFLRTAVLGTKINEKILKKIHDLAMPFAEFGIGINIDDIKLKKFNKLEWSQFKTGSLPGHDQFDIYFFNDDQEIVYKILDKQVGISSDAIQQYGITYTYSLQEKDITQIEAFLSSEEKTQILYVLIAATATGKTAVDGKIPTGPYFSNLARFRYSKPRKTVIAVDSSGSNQDTDPNNLRIVVAHTLLMSQANRNDLILNGMIENERVVQTAAIDFDSYVKILSDFAWPDDLYYRNIFNSIDSNGGTDIAKAIYASINLLKEHDDNNQPISKPVNEKNSLYILTDMDNNSGLQPVIKAIEKAAKEDIKIHLGHLKPFFIRSAVSKINNDISINSRQSVAFDDVIKSMLKTKGSYAVVEDADSQQAWMELAEYLDHNELTNVKQIALPFNVCFYSIAKAEKNTLTYLITPKKSGEITITVDSKGSFVPNLTINGVGQQKDLGQDCYEIKLRVKARKTYAVELNKPLNSQGLYSIIARLTK